jgi:hypothetical protein
MGTANQAHAQAQTACIAGIRSKRHHFFIRGNGTLHLVCGFAAAEKTEHGDFDVFM